MGFGMKEQLSALIDGEFDLDNANHLLIAAKSNGELSQAWVSYHLIGDVIRGDGAHQRDMTSRVMAAIDNELMDTTQPLITPEVMMPIATVTRIQLASKKTIYQRPAVWSIAASVAAVMFVGLMLLQQQTQVKNELMPIEIADAVPSEYLAAHQTYAPNSAAYYIHNASYADQK